MTAACNVDLDHPCDAGGRDADDNPIGCEGCQAEERYWRAYFRGMPRQPTAEEYRRDMIDGGRGHLLREDER